MIASVAILMMCRSWWSLSVIGFLCLRVAHSTSATIWSMLTGVLDRLLLSVRWNVAHWDACSLLISSCRHSCVFFEFRISFTTQCTNSHVCVGLFAFDSEFMCCRLFDELFWVLDDVACSFVFDSCLRLFDSVFLSSVVFFCGVAGVFVGSVVGAGVIAGVIAVDESMQVLSNAPHSLQ